MIKFESTAFGRVVIDGITHGDVTVVNGEVAGRDTAGLKELYGTTHLIGEDEGDSLFSGDPEAIVIGTGQFGAFKVKDEWRARCSKAGVDLVELRTPKAIAAFNRLSKDGRRVNALVHTTC